MRIRTLLALFPAALAAAAALVLGAGSAPAEAAFPGFNGKIAYSAGGAILSINPDGTGRTQLTSGQSEHSPAWSPDGQKILFYSGRSGNREIYVMNADGSAQTNLTKHAAQDESPAWSPDEQKIAFSSNRDGNYEIYVMNADGSGQTRLTNNLAHEHSPAWSPDGQKIAFEGGAEIYVMNADGSGRTRLTNHPSHRSPTWSPDGQKIAFRSFRDGNEEIYVMNADGSGQRNLTNHPASDWEPAWSPDGQKIAFSTYRDGNLRIWVVNADDGVGALVPGAFGEGADWQPVFASSPPRPELTALPQSATIELGTLRSGSAASLTSDDNVYFEVNSRTTSKLSNTSETSWYGSVPVANELASLRLAYAGKNSRTCVQQLELRDFDTGSWVVLDRRSVGTKEVAITVDASTGLGQTDAKLLRRFVSGSSGKGELHFRVRTGCDAAFVSSGELMQVVYSLS
jgi:TolB protein